MSQISLKSISGITSITTPAGVDNQLTVHTNDTTEQLKVTSDGVNVTGLLTATSGVDLTGGQITVGSNIKLGNAGVITATSFVGSGANLTGIAADKIFEGNTEAEVVDTGSNGHFKVTTEGTEKLRITSSGDVAITTRGTVEGVSKLNVEIPSRTTAFSASDGDTWHDVLIENPGAATTNAVGLCFQVTGDSYHKNAGTGIAAVKNGTNSDYGADLVFITRPQSAVAAERFRISSDGRVGINNNNPAYTLDVYGDNGFGISALSNSTAGQLSVIGKNAAGNVSAISRIKSHPSGSGNTSEMAFETRNSSSTMVEALRITSTSNVSVANTITSNQIKLNSTTTAVRNTGVSTAAGTMIYNSSSNKLQVYSENKWVSFSGKEINVSGGTISNSGTRADYVVHTFTSPGTFSTSAALEGVEIMVIGAGGGGGGHRYGSGGGAGGVIMRPASPAYPISSPAPVVVGSGGAGGPSVGSGSDGQNSTFGSGPTQLIGKGGGGGKSYDGPSYPGNPGGSGAGATSRGGSRPGGSATQPGTHGAGTDYGNRGGNYTMPGNGWAPAGGGGAGGNGTDTPTSINGGGNGGIGVQLSISGSATYYAGGGAGGIYNNQTGPNSFYGVGGNGGGGSSWNSVPGSYVGHSAPGAGAANSGGGGCGAHGQNPGSIPLNNALSAGKAGGSGIVIIAYPTTQPAGEIVI